MYDKIKNVTRCRDSR